MRGGGGAIGHGGILAAPGRARTPLLAAMSDRVLGLIGGISWESTAHYYRALNEGVREARGAPHAAELRLHSFDFARISALQHAGRWDELAVLMADAARGLAAAGAGAVMICANTMHKLVDAVETGGGLPVLHIATPTAAAARAAGCRRLLFLGTAFAMEQPFLLDRLRAEGLEVFVPEAADRAEVHRVIFEELVAGRVLPSSREALRGVIEHGVAAGAEGVILGCTELMMIVRDEDSAVPLFDTMALHAAAGVAWLLGED